MSDHMASRFGAFAAAITHGALPPEASVAAITGFTDFGACLFLGLADPVVPMIRASLDTMGPGGVVRLAFGAERASAAEAALFNGASAHASHIDDNALRNNHISSVLASALLAAGEARGSSGRDLITAYAVGYEVWARLVAAESDPYAPNGWHATAVLGPVAATAAVCNLRRTDAQTATAAIAAAASLAGGVSGNFNDWVKPYQVGRAAASGIVATRLAEAGFSCSPDALDGRTGLLAALSPAGKIDPAKAMADFGKDWRITSEGVNLKRYPMAAPVHRALDGIFEILAAHAVNAEAIESIELQIGPAEQAVLVKRLSPDGAIKPLISAELAMAAAIIARDVSAKQMQSAFYLREDVVALMRRMHTWINPELPAERDPNLGYSSVVTLRLTDGRTLASSHAAAPLGNWNARLSAAQMWDKFRSCTADALPELAARSLFDQLQSLPDLRSARLLGAKTAEIGGESLHA